MTSHEYARELARTAEKLLRCSEIEFGIEPHLYKFFCEKAEFLDTVRVLGSGTKEYKDGDLRFTPNGTCLVLSISRNSVCRKVQDEKWECDPLLSEAELASVGQ